MGEQKNMTKRSIFYKTFILALVFSLTATLTAGAAFADEATTGGERMATPFADVAKGHWAEKHIAKLALQGIVEGTGTQFAPNRSVSRQDAVIMAIRFLGKKEEVANAATVTFPDTFKVKDYAKPYVVFAFQEGLLINAEEFELAEQTPDVEWGAGEASREWVAKLMIRALGETVRAEQSASSSSTFTDDNKISSKYRGFVNAAVSLDLMKGVSATKFDPQAAVNRAMMATLLSRAQSKVEVEYPGQTKGLLTNVTADSLTLFDVEKQQEQVYTAGSSTLYYRFDSEKLSEQALMTPYAEVSLIANGTSALYVEQLNDDVKLETIQGKVNFVSTQQSKLFLEINNDIQDIPFNASELKIIGSEGETLQLSSLVKDSVVEVQRDTFRTEPRAVSVRIQGAPVSKTGTGKIVSVSGSSVQLTNDATGQVETWTAAPQALVTWNNEVRALTDLKAGDAISYEVTNSLITKIVMTQTSGKTINGEFVEITADSKVVNYTVNGSIEAKYLATNLKVTIKGINQPTISDLVRGDKLELTINDSNVVTAISVLDRGLEILNGAKVVAYYPEQNNLIVEDASGEPYIFKLISRTKYEYNDAAMTIDEVKGFLTKNRKVSISYIDKTAVSVQIVFNYTGKLINMNQTTNHLTLALDNGSSLVLPYLAPAPSVNINGKPSATIADLKIGDTVTALLDSAQEKAIVIQVHDVIRMEIVSVDVSGRKIKLRNTQGAVTEYAVPTHWKITNEDGATLTLNQLSAGQSVNLIYTGNSISALKVVKVQTGKVAAVYPDRITLNGAGGNTFDVPFVSGTTIDRNGSLSNSTSSLAVGEWVEVRNDAQGQQLITVSLGMTKKFSKYDSIAKELHVLRTSANDLNYRFAVTPDTKFFDGGEPIQVGALKSGDTIILYVSDGKLLEAVRSQ
ncbi:S-layer homology domain-containing protein [Paenibacillaceae bacterium]|nr:S-layer homology domain-containing protein [Paenibacillaceae bacterium]